jgi:hypothetical protein
MVSTILLDRYASQLYLGEITAVSDFDLKRRLAVTRQCRIGRPAKLAPRLAVSS